MESKPGVIDRSQSYVARSDILSLIHTYRPRSPSRHRSSSGSTTHHNNNPHSASHHHHATSISFSNLTPIHTLLLQGAVFQDSSEEAMLEFQKLLKFFVPTLEVLNAARSNITGRIFYQGRQFKVVDPEKEHVSVEAIQTHAPTPTVAAIPNSSMNTTSGSTDGSTSSTSNLKSIVRDDHPPLIIGVRIDEDHDDDDDDEDEDDGESSDSDSDSNSSSDFGETGETNASSSSDSSDAEGATGEGVTRRHKRKHHKRRRHPAEPEVIDLDATPLTELLARQSSNPQINGSNPSSTSAALPHHHSTSSTGGGSFSSRTGGALIPQTHNYYFYVRTLFNQEDETFIRSYVKLNWLRRLNWIDMSGTSISGYGVVSLIASCCSNIQCLFLSECAQVDNTAIYSIVNLCTSLKQLDISNCPKVNRFGLMYLAEFQLHVVQNCLEIIDVSHCGGNDARTEHSSETQMPLLSHSPISFPSTPVNAGTAATTPTSAASSSSARPPLQHHHSNPSPSPSPPSAAATPSPFSAHLVSLALFNALEERGFRGRFIWQHLPKREEFIGEPQVIKVPIPMMTPIQQQQQHLLNSPSSGETIPNVFAPPVQQYQYQLSSPFFQHYQLQSHRILDLAMRDITAQVITEVPWEWIKQQDAARMERLQKHHLQLGPTPNLPVSSSPSSAASATAGGFVANMEAEMLRIERERFAQSGLAMPENHVIPVPHFYSLNLSGHLVNDRLLFYILINWGPRLYSLTLDGTYITATGLKELSHCYCLHILSLTSCLNLIDKTKGNAILKESLRSMTYLSELNLTNSRLSGRMMSSHPNLKLEILIANGCPISSFAIRMLSSSSGAGGVSGGGHASPQDAQNMCKYSLRYLSLSNCAFVNRKSLEYIFKFAYLSLIDVSECRGLKREDIIDGFLQTTEQEIKHMEGVVMGKTSKNSKVVPAIGSTFGCMLCHLKYIVCYGIGNSFSDKRVAEFTRELNSLASKLQQLLLLHHHQLQAQLDALAIQANQQDHNLAPPLIHQTPQPPPGYLRRDFHKDPIVVIANKNSPLLQRYQPTLTRFVMQQQPMPNGSLVPVIVAIPSGLQIGSNSFASSASDLSSSGGSPPPILRGSSLLDECPYSFLPLQVPVPHNTSGGGTSTNANTTLPSSSNPASGTATPNLGSRVGSRVDLAAVAKGTSSTAFFHGATTTTLPQQPAPPMMHTSNSYMMMLNEQTSGGTLLPSTMISPPGGPPTTLTVQPPPPTIARPPSTSTSGHQTWQPAPPSTLHHSISLPNPSSTTNNGDLYFAMTPDLVTLTQQRQNQVAAMTNATIPVVQPFHTTSPGGVAIHSMEGRSSISGSNNNPIMLTHSSLLPAAFAGLSMGPSSAPPAPYASISSLPDFNVSAIPPPPPSTIVSTAAPVTSTPTVVTPPGPIPMSSGGIPASSFWSNLGSGSSATPSVVPIVVTSQPTIAATHLPSALQPSMPFVSPFAVLNNNPAGRSTSLPLSGVTPTTPGLSFPSPFPSLPLSSPSAASTIASSSMEGVTATVTIAPASSAVVVSTPQSQAISPTPGEVTTPGGSDSNSGERSSSSSA